MIIAKLSYSRSPWRLVNGAGLEVCWRRAFEHPSLGWTLVMEPVCGETKAEVLAKALEMLELAIGRENGKPYAPTKT